jgi:hypothetical protein
MGVWNIFLGPDNITRTSQLGRHALDRPEQGLPFRTFQNLQTRNPVLPHNSQAHKNRGV